MEFDWSVGEILKALDRLGMRENTLVLFTSDNGGHTETHGKHGDRQGGFNGIYRGMCTYVIGIPLPSVTKPFSSLKEERYSDYKS